MASASAKPSSFKVFAYLMSLFLVIVLIHNQLIYQNSASTTSTFTNLVISKTDASPTAHVRRNINKNVTKLGVGEAIVVNCNDPMPKTNYTHAATIVTGYFHLGKAKFSNEQYISWLKNFIGFIVDTPLVIYGSPEIKVDIDSVRTNKTGPIIYVICESIWSTRWSQHPVPKMNFNFTSAINLTWENLYRHQQPPMDPNRHLHSAELYAVWNNKAFMVGHTAEQNPFGSEFFLWVDIGSSRDDYHLHNWPSVRKLKKIFGDGRSDRILFGLIEQINFKVMANFNDLSAPYDPDTVQGGFFAVTTQSAPFLLTEFTRLHDVHFSMGHFVGQDQNLFNSVAFVNFNRTIFVRNYNLNGNCGDNWFYFRSFLAEANETMPNCIGSPLLVANQSNPEHFDSIVIS